MTAEIGHWRTPEEHELERKRAGLHALEARLAQRELDLATLQAGLAAFEARYLAALGRRFAERDALAARIAEALARKHPGEPAARERATPPRMRTAAPAAPSRPPDEPHAAFAPSERLKRLYRAVAKRIHPDLAVDAVARERRGRLMAEANRAYQLGDAARLRAIAQEWGSSPEAVEGEGAAAALVRVIRMMAQGEERLRVIDAECGRLQDSDLAYLRANVEAAERDGVDLLAQLAADLDAEIAGARRRAAMLALEPRAAPSLPEPPAPREHRLRRLTFPGDPSMGTLLLRHRDRSDKEQWVAIGDACGAVDVPAEAEVRLVVSRDVATHLAPLADLDPSALQQVVLSRTSVHDGELVHLCRLTALQRLYLDQTEVGDMGLVHLCGLLALRVLSLGHTRVTDGGLVHLRGLAALESLNLQGTRVTDAGIEQLAGLTHLEVLSLAGTRASDAGMPHLGSLDRLQTLVLAHTQVGDTGLLHVRHLDSLQWLSLAHTSITDAGLVHLRRHTRLRGLNLTGTVITDLALGYLRALTHLRVLQLGGTRITDAGLLHLWHLTGLQRLSLPATDIADAGLVHLQDLADLRELDLSDTRVSDTGVSELQRLRGLRVLRLQGTRVSAMGVRRLRHELPQCNIEPP